MSWDDEERHPLDAPFGFSAPDVPPIGVVSNAPKWQPVNEVAAHPISYVSQFDNLPRLETIAPAPEEQRDPQKPFLSSHTSEADVMEGWNPRNPIPGGIWDPTGTPDTRTDFAPPSGLPAALTTAAFPPPSSSAVPASSSLRLQPAVPQWAPPQHQVTHTGAADPYSASAARIARPGAIPLPPTGDPYLDRMRGLQTPPTAAAAGWTLGAQGATGASGSALQRPQSTSPVGAYPAWQQQGYPASTQRPAQNAAIVSANTNVFTLLGWGLIFAVVCGVIWPTFWVIALCAASVLSSRVTIGGDLVRKIFAGAGAVGLIVWFTDQAIRNGTLGWRYDFGTIAMRVVLVAALAGSLWAVTRAKSVLRRQG